MDDVRIGLTDDLEITEQAQSESPHSQIEQCAHWEMMAAMMLSHFRSNGRVCALTERTGYWFMSCRIYLLAVLVKSSITSSNSALILSIS